MQKKKMVVAVTNALLQAEIDCTRVDESKISMFRVDGIPVIITDPRGIEAYIDRTLYCLEHRKPPFPIVRKKLPDIHRLLRNILRSQYDSCMQQLHHDQIPEINVYYKSYSDIKPGTFELSAFIRGAAASLWEALL